MFDFKTNPNLNKVIMNVILVICITLFRFITMVCGTDNIIRNIHFECGKYP